MLVLGVDPGQRNLGLALVDTAAKKVLVTKTIDCGTAPYAMQKAVVRGINELLKDYPKPARVATENVPFGFGGNSKRGGITACYLWFILGGVAYWAATEGIPVSGIAPKALKTYAARTIGLPVSAWEGRTGSRAKLKAGITEAVKKITGSDSSASDHESDAILIAFALAP